MIFYGFPSTFVWCMLLWVQDLIVRVHYKSWRTSSLYSKHFCSIAQRSSVLFSFSCLVWFSSACCWHYKRHWRVDEGRKLPEKTVCNQLMLDVAGNRLLLTEQRNKHRPLKLSLVPPRCLLPGGYRSGDIRLRFCWSQGELVTGDLTLTLAVAL